MAERKVVTGMSISPDRLAQLDGIAAEVGTSRSALVDEILRLGLGFVVKRGLVFDQATRRFVIPTTRNQEVIDGNSNASAG